MKRAVITGLGIISSIGNNVEEVLASLKQVNQALQVLNSLKKLVYALKFGVN